MRLLKIEERQLPETFLYVVIQLTGRPIHGLLWFAWLWWCAAIMVIVYRMRPENISAGSSLLLWISLLTFGFYSLDLLWTLSRPAGRKWLFSVYRDANIPPIKGPARIAVRLVPALSAIAVSLYAITA